ncbi:MAG: hypothetical protein MJH10_10235 [Epibacterium sp.]|nr:hypothetical protein [Epibacterium sp.]NQX73917.1 hypothetical protein [Epibacterium sp.]
MIRLSDIEAAVCEVFGVTRAEFHGIRRFRHIASARVAFAGIARTLTNRSLPEIARHRGKDHTTILSNERSCKRRRASDPEFDARVMQASAFAQRIAANRMMQASNINKAPEIHT